MSSWPSWAIQLISGLSGLALLLKLGHRRMVSGGGSGAKDAADAKVAASAPFLAFQRAYLAVFYVTMLADWLQGPSMWDLYYTYAADADAKARAGAVIAAASSSADDAANPYALCLGHGGAACHPAAFGLKAIGTLFFVGFATSSVFSGLVGPLIDKYGRRLGCVVYCLLEIAINLMEDVADMRVLLFGRFLGGISTSLLFVSFESWMVTEHRRRGFPESLLASTFSYAQVGNGLLAVTAGFLNQRVSDAYGPIGSFRLAVAVTLVVLVCVLTTWNENYGDAKATLGSGFARAWRVIFDPADRSVLFVGISQSLFEGGMYTFVFNWVPALRAAASGGDLDMPQGLVFSCMMICVTMGGLLFEIFVGVDSPRAMKMSAHRFALNIFIVATLSFLGPAVVGAKTGGFHFPIMLASFLVFETTVGASFASMATLRSQSIPQELQGTIMNIFRVPLNVIVCLGTYLSNGNGTGQDGWPSHPEIFAVCSLLMLGCVACQAYARKE
jgi:MFS family permease